MDVWDPETLNSEIHDTLAMHSDLILDYFAEDQRLMDEHLKSDPYESLKSNKHNADFSSLLEHTVSPLFLKRRIRVWHYTRLLDDEVSTMREKLKLSTLTLLSQRLDRLRRMRLLTEQEAQIVYDQSPFHKQESARSGRIYATTVPLSRHDPGVKDLLASWGGESAYSWLSDNAIAAKLRNIGKPRTVEIETTLSDRLDAHSATETAVRAWAKKLGLSIEVTGSDHAIVRDLDMAQVLRVHTEGDGLFDAISTTYPTGCGQLLAK